MTEIYKGYKMRYYPKCKEFPKHDNKYQINKPRPYDEADYKWAFSYDKENWKVVFRNHVIQCIKGNFMEIVDELENYNSKVEKQMYHN